MDCSYIITTGWWASNKDVNDREIKYGDHIIRSKEFHKLWYKAVKKYANPKKIFIIDSNSPIKPDLGDDEVLISLLENAGHSTNHIGKLCGVSRAHLLGMSIAMVEEVDYWVYIEQDALIYGKGIIEEAISKMKKPYMFGDGFRTPQPTQQSLMIIKTEYIPIFIKNFTSIKSIDYNVSPETKFAISTSKILQLLPENLFFDIHTENLKNRVLWKLFDKLKGYTPLPFGYGRVRPINFNDKYFYFQHATNEELKNYLNVSKLELN